MQLNTDIELAIRNHKEIISIKDFANEEDIRNAIRWVMRNNPDILGLLINIHLITNINA